MHLRLLHIIFFLALTHIAGWAITFDEMAATMSPLSLPIINIESTADSTSHEYFVEGRITIVQYESDTITHNCLIRRRGRTALFLPKKSYSIKLVDENGEKVDDNLLGLRTDNTWILDAMGIDKLRMRNRVLFDIWNEFSHTMWDTKFNNRNGTVGTMVEVFINNEYNGVYCLSDKVNRQLLNLRKAKVNDNDSVTVKGLLYKGKRSGLSDNLLDYEEDRTDTLIWNTFELQYPDEFPSQQSWQPLIDLIDFNGKSEDQYFKDHYNEWYYVDNLVDYWILIVAFGLDDMPYKNTFLSTPDINFEHRYMITPWDLDACLGRDCTGKEVHTYSKLKRLNAYAPYNNLVIKNIDGFKNLLARRWLQLVEDQLSPAHLESHINEFAQRYVESGAWNREFIRWQATDIDNDISIPEDINEEIQYVMNWYRHNIDYITKQIDKWRDDYVEEDVINSSTITSIYNYILGFDTTYNEKLDINEDGIINVGDITSAYNFLLGE